MEVHATWVGTYLLFIKICHWPVKTHLGSLGGAHCAVRSSRFLLEISLYSRVTPDCYQWALEREVRFRGKASFSLLWFLTKWGHSCLLDTETSEPQKQVEGLLLLLFETVQFLRHFKRDSYNKSVTTGYFWSKLKMNGEEKQPVSSLSKLYRHDLKAWVFWLQWTVSFEGKRHLWSSWGVDGGRRYLFLIFLMSRAEKTDWVRKQQKGKLSEWGKIEGAAGRPKEAPKSSKIMPEGCWKVGWDKYDPMAREQLCQWRWL